LSRIFDLIAGGVAVQVKSYPLILGGNGTVWLMAITRQFTLGLAAGATVLSLSFGKTADDHEETLGLKNGRYWNLLRKQEKTTFILGILSAVEVAPPGTMSRYVPRKGRFTIGELIDQFDRLYTPPANSIVPIILMIPVVIEIFEGATEEEENGPNGQLTKLRKDMIARLAIQGGSK
jgi:hypothetical protein